MDSVHQDIFLYQKIKGGAMSKGNISVFYNWNKLKIKIHFSEQKKYFKQGEIWWCNVGQNVGVEINGKSEIFSRPVLIYKKFSTESFLAIPITTRQKRGTWYAKVVIEGVERVAVLSQIKTLSSFRLMSKKGKISAKDYESVKRAFKKLYID